MLPFRNIRAVLSLHAKATPGKPFIIAYDEHGIRSEMLSWQFNALAHQTAGLLRDEFGVGKGDRVAVAARLDVKTAGVYAACWLMGAAVVPLSLSDDVEDSRQILNSSGAKVLFAPAQWANQALPLTSPALRAIIQTDDAPRYPVFIQMDEAIQQRPDSFYDDDPPALTDAALDIYTPAFSASLTQAALLRNAQRLAWMQAISGSQRLISFNTPDDTTGIVTTLVTPLLVGGSLVLDRSRSGLAALWRRIADEKIHLAFLPPAALDMLQSRAAEQPTAVWGEGVGKQSLLHFRHIISLDDEPIAPRAIRQFEERFGLPVLPGYGRDDTGVLCLLPFDLSWHDHRRWLYDQAAPCIGCPLPQIELAAAQPGDGGRGELMIRLDHQREWLALKREGYVLLDDQQRRFFFLTR